MKSRKQAFNILMEICLENSYANLLLRNVHDNIQFITKIVYGTLQNYLLLEYLITQHTTKLKPKIKLLLMIASYELKFMNSESYAVINEYVEISKQLYRGSYTKLVNAVLRKISLESIDVNVDDEDLKLSITTSHPLWLVKMWNKQYGKTITHKICYANLEEKIQYIRVNSKFISKDQLLENQHFAENEYGLYYKNGNAAYSSEYQQGLISIQDYSSQQVSFFLEPQANETILDICAAPGSKTLHIAELTNGQAKIEALDLYQSRVSLIEQAKQRLKYTNIECIVADATTYHTKKQYDKVLVDAVCSGYGVLKGKSDIKYRMQPSDMDEIIKTQYQILENSSKLVKVNGILVYSTCTLNKKENEHQIKKFLTLHKEFELIAEQTILPIKVDGFYMAKLRRTI